MGNIFSINCCDNKNIKSNKIINIRKYKNIIQENKSQNLYKTSPGKPVFTLE